MLSNGLSVHDVEAVEVHNLFHVVVLIDFIKYLPCDVIIDLLEHLLELVVADAVLLVRTVLAVVVFAVGLLL